MVYDSLDYGKAPSHNGQLKSQQCSNSTGFVTASSSLVMHRRGAIKAANVEVRLVGAHEFDLTCCVSTDTADSLTNCDQEMIDHGDSSVQLSGTHCVRTYYDSLR